MTSLAEDKKILQELALTYKEIAVSPRQKELRREWSLHNALKKTRPLVLCSWDRGSDVAPEILRDQMRCQTPQLQGYERKLRNSIFHATMGDDYICEPFLTVEAVKKFPFEGLWGYKRNRKSVGQAFITEPFVETMEDVEKLRFFDHVIDEEKTKELLQFYEDVFDGTVDLCVNRRPLYTYYGNRELSTALAEILGYENMMIAMYEEPELVHEVVKFLQNAVLTHMRQGNEAGDFTPIGDFTDNCGMAYCEDLDDPTGKPKKGYSKDLFGFFAAQEFTVISADMFEEFMLSYQLPIMEQYGLISYGCCENLTGKIDTLRKIPNLRRIGVTPSADVASCAAQIERDYVFSLRPNPAMVGAGYDRDSVYRQMKQCMEAAKDTCFDVMLKDISTVQGDPRRLFEWVNIARDIASKLS
jgi:hypothetical protein